VMLVLCLGGLKDVLALNKLQQLHRYFA
jgi:hypothetical protein